MQSRRAPPAAAEAKTAKADKVAVEAGETCTHTRLSVLKIHHMHPSLSAGRVACMYTHFSALCNRFVFAL